MAAFAASVLIAVLLSFAVAYLIALLAFWCLTTLTFEWTYFGLVRVFSGSFVPLWFFPDWLGGAARLLPFQYLNYVPTALYMGRIPASHAPAVLLGGAAWVVALCAFAAALWRMSVRRLVVQGG
jgi:ABC-2 type transport system permease protein